MIRSIRQPSQRLHRVATSSPALLSGLRWSHSDAATPPTKTIADIPTPKSYPLIGNMPEILKGGLGRMPQNNKRFKKELGDVYFTKVPGFETVNLWHPADIEKVFRAEGKNPEGPNKFLRAFRKACEDSDFESVLILQSGQEWKRLRTVMQKTIFPPQAADLFIPRIGEVAKDYSDLFGRRINEGGDGVDVSEILRFMSMEMMASILFNNRIHALETDDAEAQHFVAAVQEFLDTMGKMENSLPIWQYIDTPTFKKWRQSLVDIFQYSSKQINMLLAKVDNAKTDEEAALHGNCLLGQLIARGMEKGHSVTKKEILENVGLFFFAGVDTTSISLLWIIYHLSRNPQVQQQLRDEIQQYCPDGVLTAAALKEMWYLRAVVKESARMTPAALGTLRLLDKDITVRDYHIPKGTLVTVHGNQTASCDERFIDQPDKFMPERWSAEAKAKRKEVGGDKAWADSSYLMFPFGRGPRMCVGARLANVEMCTAVTRLIHDWEFVSQGTTDGPNTEPIPTLGLLLAPKPTPVFGVSRASSAYPEAAQAVV